MTNEEARKEIIENGIDLGAGDFVGLEALKVAAAALEKVPTYEKIMAMFTPIERDFLDFKAEETIQGPNDRAIFGFDTNFPLKWLVEDYGFTEEEARWFIAEVQRLHAEKEEAEG